MKRLIAIALCCLFFVIGGVDTAVRSLGVEMPFVTVSIADSPGNWLLSYRESMTAASKAFDKRLAEKITRTRDSLIKKGCTDRETSECENLRSDYLEASKAYLDNAEANIDKALRAASLASNGYKREGKTVKTLEYIKAEDKRMHNNISKMVVLQDLAAFYDGSRRKVVSDEMLVSLNTLELGLSKDIGNFKDMSLDVEEWQLYLSALRNGVKLRSGLVKQAALLGAYRTTAMLLCLNGGKSLESCNTAQAKNVGGKLMEPFDGMTEMLAPKAQSASLSDSAIDEAKKNFRKFK